MIRRIEFENFMSLRNARVDLRPLTVFVGPNGSGKSAVFKGLTTLSRLLNGAPLRGERGDFQLEATVTFDDLVWRGNSGLTVKFRVWFDDDGEEPSYALELGKRVGGWSVIREKMRTSVGWVEVNEGHPFEFPTERQGIKVFKPPLRATLRYLVNPFVNDAAARPAIEPVLGFSSRFGLSFRYRPSASDIASFVTYPVEKKERKPGRSVAENGWGVAAELQSLQGSNRELFAAVEKAVCDLFPHVKAIGFQNDVQGVRLSFRTDRSEDLVPAPQESDGVLLATFLFWRLYTATPDIKLCLEEPENGLHPLLLADRFGFLKKVANGQAGRPAVQVLIATHSPEFLRVVKAHPQALWNDLRLVSFAPQNGTAIVAPRTFHDVTGLLDQYLDETHAKWQPVLEAWGN